jgi:hypothetical protein
MPVTSDWAPLRVLAGKWEGETGLDTSYSHARGELVPTPYRERATLTPFGPVRNGGQQLFGLDYRAAMWRGDETIALHAVVGYWMWDVATGEVLQAIVVPQGVTILAGGLVAADAVEFSLAAGLGANEYTIGESPYLAKRASSSSYCATITSNSDDTWSYSQVTSLKLSELSEPFGHADRNTLRRVA